MNPLHTLVFVNPSRPEKVGSVGIARWSATQNMSILRCSYELSASAGVRCGRMGAPIGPYAADGKP